jgi:hypothetical protein
MSSRFLAPSFTMVAALLLAPLVALGQGTANNWTPPRTADGVPDVQGIFTFRTITPLQRPQELAGKETLDGKEAAEFEEYRNRRQNRDLYNPEEGAPWAGYAPNAEGGVLSYNEFWYERGKELTKDKRTSLIVDPPNGRVPLNEATKKRLAIRRANSNSGFGNSHEDRSLSDRCIMGFNSGPPMISGAYNNNVQIFQVPGYVVILNEMVHNARIIPTDGRPHGKLRQWAGDSRGHYEGDTLVIDTINFKRETSLTGSTADTHLVERFTRVDPDTLRYEFTVEDPNSYTRPWTAVMPMRRTDGPLFEYACHEGNYGLYNILAGQRKKEREAAEAAAKQ